MPKRRRDVAHRIDTETIQRVFTQWVRVCSALTVDGTQTKKLEVAVGHELYRVSRKYVEGGDPEEQIYLGPRIDLAGVAYNRLS